MSNKSIIRLAPPTPACAPKRIAATIATNPFMCLLLSQFYEILEQNKGNKNEVSTCKIEEDKEESAH
jgi:hypothetical protein